MQNFSEKMRISAGAERLAFFSFFFFLFIHLSGCLFILLLQFEDKYVDAKWSDKFPD
jgi:hypothetical protein